MSYETAPATALLATACACCGRPLLDSVSVEAGVGPVCREKYGFGEAQASPDWTAYAALAIEGAIPGNAQDAANFHVAQIARGAGPLDLTSRHIAAVRALGFRKLAERLAERAGDAPPVDATIRVDAVDGALAVRSPYNPLFTAAVKAIPGRRFFKDGKDAWWTVPATARKALWTALQQAYPAGTPVTGSKGTKTL